MQKFSAWSLLKEAFNGHQGWKSQWRRAAPKAEYDAIVIGGGGHGLGTAYYLAAEHGLTNIAVVEKGWIGGGNTGRNTTIIRSNYLFDESARLYDHSLKLWKDLSQVLNYNTMFSPRGVMMLAHTVHDMQVSKRHIHANRGNGATGDRDAKVSQKGCQIVRDCKRHRPSWLWSWVAQGSVPPAPRGARPARRSGPAQCQDHAPCRPGGQRSALEPCA